MNIEKITKLIHELENINPEEFTWNFGVVWGEDEGELPCGCAMRLADIKEITLGVVHTHKDLDLNYEIKTALFNRGKIYGNMPLDEVTSQEVADKLKELLVLGEQAFATKYEVE